MPRVLKPPNHTLSAEEQKAQVHLREYAANSFIMFSHLTVSQCCSGFATFVVTTAKLRDLYGAPEVSKIN